ncbi:THO complex, subunit THOC1 [Corchorus olitorius]|uniref:THO complex, subunit THOC1 n=1 Tax=Corchorus olitorius TaxID=93759 RepID=A0A1R3J4H8_9ROSI|nr:THO complex, subunit THOC1 [Corchorus olitorius]
MEDFRRVILQPGPPESFALQAVQEVIKPQKAKLAQDENQLLENMLRTLLQELVSSAVQSGEEIMQYGKSIDDDDNAQGVIPRLLDIVLYLCEKEHVEGGMIFQLLEDLTEMSTMRNCKDVFQYIESKQDILGKQELFSRGKLVMLRTCNQLLRRLSKANDVVFCGRILMFLAHFFPLSERSAVNIKGVFNTSNQTKFEKDPPEGIALDFNFYKTLWSLQEYFCNPVSLSTTPIKWQKFTSSLMVVLNTFEAQPLSEEEGAGNNLEEEGTTFNIKYLTSSSILRIYQMPLAEYSKFYWTAYSNLANPTYITPHTDQSRVPLLQEIKSCEDRVKKLLEVTPPKGKDFLHCIEHILEREKNWVWWKRDGCPPFEKQPIEKKTAQDGVKKRRPRWRLGNKELSQLWKWADQNPNALTDPQRVRTPAITDYWKPLAEDVSSVLWFFEVDVDTSFNCLLRASAMDESAGIEAEYHHKNNRVYCWKGLRFSARQDLEGFSKFTEHGIEGVVPLELLPPEVRSKFQGKPNDRSKRAKKEDTKNASHQVEESQIATHASEIDGEGTRADTDASAAPMDTDATAATGNNSQGGTPTPDEHQKQSPDIDVGQEAGQLEPDAEVEAGMIDGETDPEPESDHV